MTRIKVNFVLSVSTLLVFTSCFFTLPVAGSNHDNIINPNWKRPSIWNRRQNNPQNLEQCGECPPVEPCPPCEVAPPPEPPACQQMQCELEFQLFKKFLRRLFDKKRLHKDFESDYLLNHVQLKITQFQLDMLLQTKNIRELDGIVSSVVEQSEGGGAGFFAQATESFCWSVGELFQALGSNGYFLYLFVPTLGLLGVYWLVKVNARIMGIHPLVALVLMALLMSYFITYRNCNRRMEADALAKMSFSDGSNPCQQRAQRSTGVFGWIADFLGSSSEARCREHLLRHSEETTINICDPSTVAIEMAANLQMHYLETFIQKMVSIYQTSTAGYGIPGTVMMGLFICMLLYVLVTATVKYGLYGWFNFLGICVTGRPRAAHPTNALPANQQQQQQLPITLNINLNHPVGATAAAAGRISIDTNRIEEIAEPRPPLALESAPSSNEQDGSGDAPRILPEKQTTEDKSTEDDVKSGSKAQEAKASDDQKEETVGP